MAHVADTPPPHPLVTMRPQAWSTQHQNSNSQSHPLSFPAYPSSSSFVPDHASSSSHQHSNTYQLQPSPSPDLPSADPSDQLNADTIFRDLLNLHIANHNSSETTPSLQPHIPLHSNPIPAQITPHPPLLHQDVFSHPDPDPGHLAHIPDHLDSHLCSLPFLHHHLHQNPQDPPLTDHLSIPHPPAFPPHASPHFASNPLVGPSHASQRALFASSSVSEQSARSSNPSRSQPPSVPTHPGPRIKNDLYKTEICRSFAENAGFCKYGSKCQFAHGEEELRPVRRHPRYKTKLCRNFANNGSCPYDTRCRFIHANDLSFVSVPALSTLHQSSGTAVPGSDTPENHQYEATNLTSGEGEEYTDHLRRILSMTPASSAPSITASGEPSIPRSSPHASPPATDVEQGRSPLDTSKKLSSHITYGRQGKQQGDSAMPADVYHVGANAFRNYPDNAFNQPYVPLVPVTSESALGSSKSGDNVAKGAAGSLQEKRAVDSAELGSVFRPTADPPVSEAFGSEVSAKSASKEEVITGRPANDKPKLSGDDALIEPRAKATSAQGTRGRLPVFRNITSDGDSS